MTSSSSFVQRVLAFSTSPFQSFGGLDEDYLNGFSKSDSITNKSSLLEKGESTKETTTWLLDRLQAQRVRPFSSVSIVVPAVLCSLVAALVAFGYYRQSIATGEQSLVTIVGYACIGAVIFMNLLHTFSVMSFSRTRTSTLSVSLTTTLQFLSFLAILGNAAFTLRFWDNEPFISTGKAWKDHLLYPQLVYILSLSAACLVLQAIVLLSSASIPFASSRAVHQSALSWSALIVSLLGLAACILGMITVISSPTTYFDDLIVWGLTASGLFLSLLGVGLVGAVYPAYSPRDLSAFWTWGLPVAAVLSGVVAGFGFVDTLPEIGLPLAVSDTLYISSACSAANVAMLLLTLGFIVSWKVHDKTYDPSTAPCADEYDY